MELLCLFGMMLPLSVYFKRSSALFICIICLICRLDKLESSEPTPPSTMFLILNVISFNVAISIYLKKKSGAANTTTALPKQGSKKHLYLLRLAFPPPKTVFLSRTSACINWYLGSPSVWSIFLAAI